MGVHPAAWRIFLREVRGHRAADAAATLTAIATQKPRNTTVPIVPKLLTPFDVARKPATTVRRAAPTATRAVAFESADPIQLATLDRSFSEGWSVSVVAVTAVHRTSCSGSL